MRLKIALLAFTALSVISVPAFAESASEQAAEAGVGASSETVPGQADIIVTARRESEKLQDVPVAVSVITPAMIESKGVFDPVDLRTAAPGLAVSASVSDRSNLTYTIRGQGFAFGTLFPAVITYFNEVPIANLAAGQFFDIANVQVLRGPQGVAFGRVTDGGNVMITAQMPKDDFGGYFGAKVGDYGLRTVNGAVNLPVVADKVLLRMSFETARRDGFTTNLHNDKKLDNVAYEGYRGILTLRPTDWLENSTTVSYLNTHDNGTAQVNYFVRPGRPSVIVGSSAVIYAGGYGIDANGDVVPFAPGLTPFTGANYEASLIAQNAAQTLRGKRQVSLTSPSFNRRKNLYVVNSSSLHISEEIELKNIFGYVHEKVDSADNYVGLNGGYLTTCHSACNPESKPFLDVEQFSNELRLSGRSFDGRLTWALGGYLDEQRPGGKFENSTINGAVIQRVGVRYATTKSRAIYGSGEFEVVDNLKINGGARYTHDTLDARQATYLAPIPGGEQALFNFLTAPTAAQMSRFNAILGPRGFTGPLSAADANTIVANTFAPIPHGECVSYGFGASPAYNSITGTATCLNSSGSFNSTTWQIGATYKLANSLFYAKISKGYRPGGVNSTAPAGVDPSYDPETDVSIEAGIKADFRFNGMFLRTNLAAYTDRYKGIQKNISRNVNGIPVSNTANAADARIRGIEFETTFIPIDGVTFGGTYAYTDAKFDSDTFANAQACDPDATAGALGFCPRNRFNSTPKHQLSITGDVVLPIGNEDEVGRISVGGRLYHQSSMAFGDVSALNPDAIEPSYTTLDLNLNWKNALGRPVDLGFFMTNVTDKIYRVGNSSLSQAASVGIASAIYAAPRMWGFSLKYRFGSDAD